VSTADLRTFVELLEQRGELRRISTEVDPILEITEIADRVMKAGGPALLFENVRGSRFPLVINTFGTEARMCLALGCRSFDEMAARVQNVIKPEIPTTLMQKLRKLPELAQLGSLPPKVVRRGACQEVVHTDDANLFDLPVLKCWPHDGDPAALGDDRPAVPTAADQVPGRYITLGGIFTRHPETGDRNVGMYRVQLFEPRLAAMHWHPHHDGARHFRAYRARGERMPVAIALGGPAILPYAATCPLPPGIDECLFAGFLQGRALELVPCVTQPDVQVPTTCEFVIEGYIDPAEPPMLRGPLRRPHRLLLAGRSLSAAATSPRSPTAANRSTPSTIVGLPPHGRLLHGQGDRARSSCRCCRRSCRTWSTTTCRCSAASTTARSSRFARNTPCRPGG
jgi:4-hydroxy-3-polyprenylbenzoate decarboxylase